LTDHVLFTSESVTEGHPDKVADQISDAILDAFLSEDHAARVACETLVARGLIVIAGEVSASGADRVDVEAVARDVVRRIGYVDPEMGFAADDCEIQLRLSPQSPDIARGVDHAADGFVQTGAGDQGLMFGYASSEAPATLMPIPIALAHALARRLATVRHDATLPWLGPDGKTQVTVAYRDGRPVEIAGVLVSTQHAPELEQPDVLAAVRDHVVAPVLAQSGWEADLDGSLLVNPTGRFVLGGPAADCGLTGRKIIVDTYGGMARHGGGAFSGKDPSKVDRSAAYAARHLAKNIVAAGLAARCEVQVAYAIGRAAPVSLFIEDFGSATCDRSVLEQAIRRVVDLRPDAIRSRLELARPIYEPTAAYGHFGRDEETFAWERTDLTDALRVAVQERASLED
jgi:S-adenosylmethionine synthetase